MSFYTEGWRLLKLTWRPTLRLAVLAVPFMLPYLVGPALARFDVRPIWAALAWLGGLGSLVFFPAFSFAGFSIVSAPYFSEAPRVRSLVKEGFSHWVNMFCLTLFGVLFLFPFLVIATTLEEVFGGSALATLLVPFPFQMALAIYWTFAGLIAVRHNLTAWDAWTHAFRLIPLADWLNTVGTLICFNVLMYGAQAAWPLVLPALGLDSPGGSLLALFGFAQLVITLAVTVLAWYLFLCQVALWRQYTRE